MGFNSGFKGLTCFDLLIPGAHIMILDITT